MDSPEVKESPSQDEYTIIRIKRKRSEDVPDVLVVNDKGIKRRKSRMNIFKFAETFDEATWKEMKQDELRNRISALSRSVPKVDEVVIKDEDASCPREIKRQRGTQGNDVARQYRVITQGPQRASRFYPMPPRVLSSKDIEKGAPKVRIYDAELAPPEAAPNIDPEMEKFQTLLQDYLKVHDDMPDLPGAEKDRDDPDARADLSPSTSGDYVYDIFYHRPSALAAEAGAGNVATITGLPFDDDDDFDSDSEVEDEADEDSNAEDYYKNDYPDEESAESNSEGSYLWSEGEYDGRECFEPDY